MSGSDPSRSALGAPFAKDRLLVIAGTLTLLVAAALFAPHVSHGPVVCPLRAVTGFPCPGCGMTRAFCALTRGHVAKALADNAFSLPLFALVLAAPLVAAIELAKGRKLAFYRFLYSHRVAIVAGAALATYHVARCALWLANGTLWHDYVRQSLLFRLVELLG